MFSKKLEGILVPQRGLEPLRLSAHGPKPCLSTSFNIWAKVRLEGLEPPTPCSEDRCSIRWATDATNLKNFDYYKPKNLVKMSYNCFFVMQEQEFNLKAIRRKSFSLSLIVTVASLIVFVGSGLLLDYLLDKKPFFLIIGVVVSFIVTDILIVVVGKKIWKR